MDLKQFALEILNNNCPSNKADADGVIVHVIELHCLLLTVRCRITAYATHTDGDEMYELPSDYEILELTWTNN